MNVGSLKKLIKSIIPSKIYQEEKNKIKKKTVNTRSENGDPIPGDTSVKKTDRRP